MLSGSSALRCFVFHPCPACRVRRRELRDRSIGASLIMTIRLHSIQTQSRASTAQLGIGLSRRRNDITKLLALANSPTLG